MKNTDQVKGRVKEAAGDLLDNKNLKREGQADRVAGKAKETLSDLREKAEEGVDAIKDRIHDAVRKH